MSDVLEKKYTIDEYLDLERKSVSKHEFYNGNIVEMPGGTFNHNLIASNLLTAFNNGLDMGESKYFVLNSDMKIYLQEYNHFVYPDCVVVFEKPEFYLGHDDVLANPILVIEVISPSSRVYDHGEKFYKYRTLPSLKEYVVVSQDQPMISAFYQEKPKTWTETVSHQLEGTILFKSVECKIPLRKIYRGVDFTAE